MDSIAHLEAIRQDPDDEKLRRAYADWLAANHEADRAEWIRASCDLALIEDRGPVRDAAREREQAAFARCRPAWWDDMTNVDQTNERGLFRFVLGTSRSSRGAKPFQRFGKVPWLGQAYD